MTEHGPGPVAEHGGPSSGVQPSSQQQGGVKQQIAWGRVIVFAIALLLVLGVVVLSALYALEFFRVFDTGWVVERVDGFWRWFDGSIERLKILASLLPLLVVGVAYLVYRSDQWWKRAQWALDAATADISTEEAKLINNRRTLGMKAIRELGSMRMAPRKDEYLFAILTAHAAGIEAARIAARAKERQRPGQPDGSASESEKPKHGLLGWVRRIMKG